jgi:hypothetical protein
MPNFNIVDRPNRRFDGDFSLEPVAGHLPSAGERAYLETLGRVTHSLAQDEAADALRPAGEKALTLAMKKARADAARELRSQAEKFNSGVLPADNAADDALVRARANT